MGHNTPNNKESNETPAGNCAATNARVSKSNGMPLTHGHPHTLRAGKTSGDQTHTHTLTHCTRVLAVEDWTFLSQG